VTTYFQNEYQLGRLHFAGKAYLNKLEQNREIERWKVDLNSLEHLLEIVTSKMSPEQIKHYIRTADLKESYQGSTGLRAGSKQKTVELPVKMRSTTVFSCCRYGDIAYRTKPNSYGKSISWERPFYQFG
jgi:hypothetical protein